MKKSSQDDTAYIFFRAVCIGALIKNVFLLIFGFTGNLSPEYIFEQNVKSLLVNVPLLFIVTFAIQVYRTYKAHNQAKEDNELGLDNFKKGLADELAIKALVANYEIDTVRLDDLLNCRISFVERYSSYRVVEEARQAIRDSQRKRKASMPPPPRQRKKLTREEDFSTELNSIFNRIIDEDLQGPELEQQEQMLSDLFNDFGDVTRNKASLTPAEDAELNKLHRTITKRIHPDLVPERFRESCTAIQSAINGIRDSRSSGGLAYLRQLDGVTEKLAIKIAS